MKIPNVYAPLLRDWEIEGMPGFRSGNANTRDMPDNAFAKCEPHRGLVAGLRKEALHCVGMVRDPLVRAALMYTACRTSKDVGRYEDHQLGLELAERNIGRFEALASYAALQEARVTRYAKHDMILISDPARRAWLANSIVSWLAGTTLGLEHGMALVVATTRAGVKAGRATVFNESIEIELLMLRFTSACAKLFLMAEEAEDNGDKEFDVSLEDEIDASG